MWKTDANNVDLHIYDNQHDIVHILDYVPDKTLRSEFRPVVVIQEHAAVDLGIVDK